MHKDTSKIGSDSKWYMCVNNSSATFILIKTINSCYNDPNVTRFNIKHTFRIQHAYLPDTP